MIPTVENVLSVFHAATDEQMTTGLDWYNDAHEFALSLDASNPSRAAGVIAALSPMMGWDCNKMQAGRVFERGNAAGLGLARNCDKAQMIYDGSNPEDVLKGDKVCAFYRTILNPTGDISPVIDRHAFDIAVGRVTDDKSRSMLTRKGVYDSFANVYRHAAIAVGVGAAQMQAVTWTAWREGKSSGLFV